MPMQPAVWVSGSPDLAARVVAGLRREGRRARILAPERLEWSRLGACRVLVLADPPERDRLLLAIAHRLGGTRRAEPLRVILMHRCDPPPAPPAPLADLDPEGALHLETFAIEDRAARAILARWPLHCGMDPGLGQRPHLLIAGLAPPARALLVQALRLIHYGEERPRITLACDDPESCAEGFAAAYPQADQVAEIRWAGLDRPDLGEGPPPTQVAVCVLPPERGLDLAQALAGRLASRARVSPPILLEVGDSTPAGELDAWDGQIFPISYLGEACRPGVLLDGAGDRLARTIHEHYIDSIAAQGRDPQQEPAGRPWGRLAESYREANRHQADHLGAKLAATDCRAVAEERVESFAFAPLEAERLAVIEHLRWAADRYLDGWAYAPVRDNARKHHPQLIPYPGLSEPIKDLDRFAVRGVPALLARSGLGVVRMLILGLPEPHPDCPGGRGLRRLLDRVFERLVARYPDRSLVVASTLADPRARLAVHRALELAGAGLFLLCPRPIGETVAAQPDRAARRDLLRLVARAERRIPLPGPGQLDRWLAERAEICLALGPGSAAPAARKLVLVDASRQRLEWGFDY